MISIRRSDAIYNSGKVRFRGSLFATVLWDDSGRKREYHLSDVRDINAECDE